MSGLPPQPPKLGSLAQSSKLGSLAQSARGKRLNQARTLLIVIAVLNFLSAGFVFWIMGRIPDPDVAQLLRIAVVVNIGLGVIYGFFAVILRKFPVPVTVISLVLYLGVQAVGAAQDPTSLAQGWWLKLIIIFAMVKAIQAAVAYQKEENAAAADAAEPIV